MRWLRYAVGLWYAATFALAAVGWWSLGKHIWRRPWLWGLLLVAAFTLVHTVYWTNLRMRAPLVPVIALWAAVGLAAAVGRMAGRAEVRLEEPASEWLPAPLKPSDVMLDPWTDLPAPPPGAVVTVTAGPPVLPDAPDLPSDERP